MKEPLKKLNYEPKISVIIPVYNTDKYLKECLDSVINQTLKDIEIICIDDGSTDSSLNILKEYAQKDNRIIIIEQNNKGAGAARNRGLEIARGEYVYFLDSDDYIENVALEKLYQKIIEENAQICICKRKCYYEKTNETKIDDKSLNVNLLSNFSKFSYKDLTGQIFQFCIIGVFIKLYKKDFIQTNNIKFQEIKTTNDIFFNYATLMFSDAITYINEALHIYRINREGCLTLQRGKSIDCVLEAYCGIKKLLEQKNIFEQVEDSFYRRAICSIKCDINLCTGKNKKIQYKKFRKFIPNKYWSLYVKKSSKRGFFQQIFSITNSKDKKHKILTILGLSIKFKRIKPQQKKAINFRKFTDLSSIIRKHISILPQNMDLIVGVPRSGIIPAYMVALFLNKRVCSLPEFINDIIPQNGERSINGSDVSPKNILIVDDSVLSGNALTKVKKQLSQISNKYNIKYLCIFATKASKHLVDYYFEIVQTPRIFQWNYLNHSIAQQSCYDIDGVLCVDPTPEENDDGEKYINFILHAKPLYIPTYKIHSIVTSRLEKYRSQTEQWLKENNVKYENLFMLKNVSAEERRRLKLHAKFKAEIYKNSKDCNLFVESNPQQAEEIYNLTKKPVICVETDEIFE